MINLSNFVKEHASLCICTLGLAILGYLGYHAVRWIINKCQRTEEIDLVAQKSLNHRSSFHSPESLINRASHLEISPDKITMGQGEYIVFHKLPDGTKRDLSPETFEHAYQTLVDYSPAALMNSGSPQASEKCANRYELIKEKLKEIDPTLETVFIPRTLYELIFIKKCINEDLKHNSICTFQSPIFHQMNLDFFGADQQKYEDHLKRNATIRKERKCWHLCYFKDGGDNEHPGVKEVAYRLNRTMVKAFDPSIEGFTHQEFSAFAEKEIAFLSAHYRDSIETIEKRRRGERVEEIADCIKPSPTNNFGFESSRGSVKPMGIRHETDAQMIRDAIALDCSQIAQHSLFIYRGADFQKDSTSSWSDQNTAYSLSYGASLFAGCLYDGGATAFYYMRNGKNGYAIPVPFDQLNSSPFYVPTTHTVAQLFGDGEIFHARTKAWRGFDVKRIGGINMGENSLVRGHLKSDLSQDELTRQFREYKKKAIQLK